MQRGINMINYRPLTDEELETEADKRITNLVEELGSIYEEALPLKLLNRFLSDVNDFDWEGYIIEEHIKEYEDYRCGES
jgi:hypothetical protein